MQNGLKGKQRSMKYRTKN